MDYPNPNMKLLNDLKEALVLLGLLQRNKSQKIEINTHKGDISRKIKVTEIVTIET